MTWRTWKMFTTALESLEIGTSMKFFYPKQKMCELKICRGSMCHDNEEWCKIWRTIDFSFQNLHHNLTNFNPCTQMYENITCLMGSLWPKYMIFELKIYRGVIFDGTEDWCKKKNKKKTDLCFLTGHRKFSKFSLAEK